MRPDSSPPNDEFGQRLRPYLDASCDRLPDHVVQRLAQARQVALQRATTHVPVPAFAGLPSGWMGLPGWRRGWSWRKLVVLAVLLGLTAGGAQRWQVQHQRDSEVEQDVATLMGEDGSTR